MKWWKEITWERAADMAQVGATLVAALSAIFAGVQLMDSKNSESVTRALAFDDRIRTSPAPDMLVRAVSIPSRAIFTNHFAPETKENGRYSYEDGAEVLSTYDTVYYLLVQHAIKPSAVYNLFCSDVDVLFNNNEIAELVNGVRKDPKHHDAFTGFILLDRQCKEWTSDGSAKRFVQGKD